MKISADLLAKGINSTKTNSPNNNNSNNSPNNPTPTNTTSNATRNLESKGNAAPSNSVNVQPGPSTAKKPLEQPKKEGRDIQKPNEPAKTTKNGKKSNPITAEDIHKMHAKMEKKPAPNNTKPLKAQVKKESNVKVSVHPENEINMKSIENLLDYIEGTPKIAPKAPPAPSIKQVQDDKAALKKARQKARQLELERLESLKGMNVQLLEVTTESKQLANQLVQIRRGKRKDPLKVAQVEFNVEETLTKKFRLEIDIMNELKEIKTANAGFDVREGCMSMKAVLDLVETKENLESQKQQMLTNSTAQPGMNPEDDPSRRMVTIRRVNLPYSEPQVTVTAKGTTPEQDQLLYTFINGQMMPAFEKKTRELEQVLLAKQISQMSFQPASKSNNINQLSEKLMQLCRDDKKPVKVQTNGPAKQSDKPVSSVKVVKTAQKTVEAIVPEKMVPVQVEKKTVKVNEIPKSRSALKKELKAQMKQAKVALEIKELPKEEVKTRSALKKERKASKQTDAAKVKAQKEEKLAEKADEKPKEIKRAFIDPEFDNNAFRLLDLYDDPSSSDSEMPVDSEVEEELIVPPPPVVEEKLSNKNIKKNKAKLDLELAKMESKKDALAKQANIKKQKKYAEAVNKAAAELEKKSEMQKKVKQLTKEQVKQKKIEDLSRNMAALQSNYREKVKKI